MKENYINWIGNRVLDPGSQNQKSMSSKEPGRIYSPTQPVTPQKSAMNQQQIHQSERNIVSQMQNDHTREEQSQIQSPITQLGDAPSTGFEAPPTLANQQYIPGYLRNLIGRRIRAEFVLGTNLYLDKTGILREVGVNYFVLEDLISGALIVCDLYSVKFVTTI